MRYLHSLQDKICTNEKRQANSIYIKFRDASTQRDRNRSLSFPPRPPLFPFPSCTPLSLSASFPMTCVCGCGLAYVGAALRMWVRACVCGCGRPLVHAFDRSLFSLFVSFSCSVSRSFFFSFSFSFSLSFWCPCCGCGCGSLSRMLFLGLCCAACAQQFDSVSRHMPYVSRHMPSWAMTSRGPLYPVMPRASSPSPLP